MSEEQIAEMLALYEQVVRVDEFRVIRNISSFELDKNLGDGKRFIARQSFSVFDRTIHIPAYTFTGVEYNSYTDIAYVSNGTKNTFVLGGNFIYNNFNEKAGSSSREGAK